MLAEPLNMRPKYVAATTLVEPLEWQHSTLLRGDVGDAVRALKVQDGDDLLVIGSPGLVQSLVEHRPARRGPGNDRSARRGLRQAPLRRRQPDPSPASRRESSDGHGRDHRDLRCDKMGNRGKDR